MRDDGSILNVAAGVSNDIGGRIPHVWVPRGSGLVSTLDLLGEGHTLFAGPDWQGRVPDRAGAEPPLNIERLDAVSARALGLTAAGSLLARTDGQQIALSNGSLTDRRVGSDWIRASHERIMARLH